VRLALAKPRIIVATTKFACVLIGTNKNCRRSHLYRATFFHVRQGQVTTMDTVGVALAGYAEAVKEAKKRGPDLAARDALSGRMPIEGTFIIDDE